MNTADYLLLSSKDENIAFITKDNELTYGLFKQMCASVLHDLLHNEIKPGDRVAICGLNSPSWAAAYLATMKLGAVVVPLATVLSPDELKRDLAFANCKFIFVDKALFPKFSASFGAIQSCILDESLLQPPPCEWPAPDPNVDLNADVALMFTSGTTALPRAVRITHRNIQANTDTIVEYLHLSAQERMMVILPFYYCYGASLLHSHLRVGGSLVISNTFTYPETILDLMSATNCTGLAGVPSTFQALLRNSTFPRRELPSLRKIQQAGGKLHNELLKELVASHPAAQVYVMYGQTEATARLSYLPPELLPTKMGSVGKGAPGITLQVLDENKQPVKPGEVGEIVGMGDNVSPGYLDDPAANAEKFLPGKLFTGDMATVDEDGFIYVVDRKSDFIKSYGHRISSYEIESCVLKIPDIVAAAAVGVPDAAAGELIRVFITLRTDSTCQVEDVLKHCRANLSRHMVPKEIYVIDALPLNANGKVVKSLLRKDDLIKK